MLILKEQKLILKNGLKTLQSKNRNQENFPVASFMIDKNKRPIVIAYYNFARMCDDIADNPKLTKKEKLESLERIENIITGKETKTGNKKNLRIAKNLYKVMIENNLNIENAYNLLVAFKQDSKGYKYQIWEELIEYCRYSAAPVGRFLLDIHSEKISLVWNGDAFCAALQIINHLQDIKKDYTNLKRIYFPKKLLEEFKINSKNLTAETESKSLKKFKLKIISNIEGLLCESEVMIKRISSFRLRVEVAVMFCLAKKLTNKLETSDILEKHIKLNKIDWIYAGISGLIRAILKR